MISFTFAKPSLSSSTHAFVPRNAASFRSNRCAILSQLTSPTPRMKYRTGVGGKGVGGLGTDALIPRLRKGRE